MQDNDAYAKVASASTSGGGNYIKHGKYLFLIRKFFLRKGYEGRCFILELEVAQAAPNGEVDAANQVILPNAVGSKCSCAWNIDSQKSGKSAAGNVKEFVLAILGKEEGQVTEQDYINALRQMSDDATNPLRGRYLKGETFSKPIRSAPGKFIVKPNWERVPQTKDEVAARRASMDKAEIAAAAMPSSTPAPVAPAPVAPPPPAPPVASALDDIPF